MGQRVVCVFMCVVCAFNRESVLFLCMFVCVHAHKCVYKTNDYSAFTLVAYILA